MSTLALLLLLSLLQPSAPPPPLAATWQSPTIARLTWSQAANVRETCLLRQPAGRSAVLVRCWGNLPPGPSVVSLGSAGGLDGAFRPAAGDVFVVTQDGRIEKAPLVGRLYVAVWRG